MTIKPVGVGTKLLCAAWVIGTLAAASRWWFPIEKTDTLTQWAYFLPWVVVAWAGSWFIMKSRGEGVVVALQNVKDAVNVAGMVFSTLICLGLVLLFAGQKITALVMFIVFMSVIGW